MPLTFEATRAAAATLGRFVYVFGGGDGVGQLDHVLRIDPLSGRVLIDGGYVNPVPYDVIMDRADQLLSRPRRAR